MAVYLFHKLVNLPVSVDVTAVELFKESFHMRYHETLALTCLLVPGCVAGRNSLPGCRSELVNQDNNGWTYFLAGSPSDLDPVLGELKKNRVVKDIVYSVIGL